MPLTVIFQKHKLCKSVMIEPHDDECIQLKNFNRVDRIPILIYADFYCFLKPVNNIISNKTKKTHYHKSMSYVLFVKLITTLSRLIINNL